MKRALLIGLLTAVAACGDAGGSPAADTGGSDAGVTDAGGGDAGVGGDAGLDAVDDTSGDAGADAEPDAEPDAGEDVEDATMDASTDPEPDAIEPDAGEDAGEDASEDVAPDAPEVTWALSAPETELEGPVASTVDVTLLALVDGAPAEGSVVAFSIDEGATLGADSVVVDAGGRAVASVTLGTTLGVSTVTATLVDADVAPVDVRIERRAGRVALVEVDTATMVVPGAVDLEVAVSDAYDNPVAGVPLVAMRADGVGTVVLDEDDLTTDDDGRATLGVTIDALDESVAFGEPTTVATVGTPDARVDVELTFIDPTTLVISDDLPNYFVGLGEVEEPVVVTVVDDTGTPVAGVEVEIEVEDGDWLGSTGTTNADGEATLTMTAPALAGEETRFGTGLAGSVDDTSRLAMSWTYTLERDGFVTTFDSDLVDGAFILGDTHLDVDTEHEFSDGGERVAVWTIELATGTATPWFAREDPGTIAFRTYTDDGAWMLMGVIATDTEPAHSLRVHLETGAVEPLYDDGYVLNRFDESDSGTVFATFENTLTEDADARYELHRLTVDDGTLEHVVSVGNTFRSAEDCEDVLVYQLETGRNDTWYARHGEVEASWSSGDVRVHTNHADDGACRFFLTDRTEDETLYLMEPTDDGFASTFLMTGHNLNYVLAAADLSFIVVDSWADEIPRRIDLEGEITLTELMGDYDPTWYGGFLLADEDSVLVTVRNFLRTEPEVYGLPVDGSGPDEPAVYSAPVPEGSASELEAWDFSDDGLWVATSQTRVDEWLGEGIDSSTIAGLWVRDMSAEPEETVFVDDFDGEAAFMADGTGIVRMSFDPSSRWLALSGDPIEDEAWGVYLYDLATGEVVLVDDGFASDATPDWSASGDSMTVGYGDMTIYDIAGLRGADE